MEFLKSKLGIAVIVIVVAVTLILVSVFTNSKRDDNDQADTGQSITTPTQSEAPPQDQANAEDQPSVIDNWPSDWPAKPTSTENSTPLPEKPDNHDHGDPGAAEEDVPENLEDPESAIKDYVDDEHHAKEENEAVDVAVFPEYKTRMLKFAQEYANANRSGGKWWKGIEPYVDSSYKELYEGVEPKYFGFPETGEVTIMDNGDNLTGKVQFTISKGGEKIAKIIAQYQDDWRVIQIDEP